MEKTVLFWFRRDLRLHDNQGLFHALNAGYRVIPIFIFDPDILDKLDSRQDHRVSFIYRAVRQLKAELNGINSDLLVLHDRPLQAIQALLGKFQVEALYFNRDYEPDALKRDLDITTYLKSRSTQVHTYKDHCIFEHHEILKSNGEPYTVFTPYAKQWKLKFQQEEIAPYPNRLYFQNFQKTFQFDLPKLSDLGFQETEKLDFPSATVSSNLILEYSEKRNFPALDGTSKLSVHLRFGTVSIREMVLLASCLNETWLNEFIWRDFYIQIMAHFPYAMTSPFKKQYGRIEWRNDVQEFEAWCAGKTGYPLVDAGMRELNQTGFMHNRVRMVVASFLCKHLLIDYRWGEAYFAEKLLDFELASNNGGWQWACGSGVDAAPYFRIFNPVLQQERFDKEFKYIRRWLPEFNTNDYPLPLVDHSLARKRCLDVYKAGLNENYKSGIQKPLFDKLS